MIQMRSHTLQVLHTRVHRLLPGGDHKARPRSDDLANAPNLAAIVVRLGHEGFPHERRCRPVVHRLAKL